MFKTSSATQFRFMSVLALSALATVGCGHEATATRVRFADFDHGALKGYDGSRPLIIEFQPGERLPVNLEVSGQGFELAPQHPPLELVATEHCFVRVGSDGFHFSRDGMHFDKPRKRGTFRIGIWSRAGQHARLDVVLVGPHD
ncbi:MAG TPA: hypothetical protein VMI54_23960 [Polyangiaceae bacterium]|nr:hypothetical protein [Polyangiaceae bacterium]